MFLFFKSFAVTAEMIKNIIIAAVKDRQQTEKRQ